MGEPEIRWQGCKECCGRAASRFDSLSVPVLAPQCLIAKLAELAPEVVVVVLVVMVVLSCTTSGSTEL